MFLTFISLCSSQLKKTILTNTVKSITGGGIWGSSLGSAFMKCFQNHLLQLSKETDASKVISWRMSEQMSWVSSGVFLEQSWKSYVLQSLFCNSQSHNERDFFFKVKHLNLINVGRETSHFSRVQIAGINVQHASSFTSLMGDLVAQG